MNKKMPPLMFNKSMQTFLPVKNEVINVLEDYSLLDLLDYINNNAGNSQHRTTAYIINQFLIDKSFYSKLFNSQSRNNTN